MINDIIAEVNSKNSTENISSYIDSKFSDVFSFKYITEQFIYLSDREFSYVIEYNGLAILIYHENNIQCDICDGKGGFQTETYPEPCPHCNATGLSNFYTDGEFILRSK